MDWTCIVNASMFVTHEVTNFYKSETEIVPPVTSFDIRGLIRFTIYGGIAFMRDSELTFWIFPEKYVGNSFLKKFQKNEDWSCKALRWHCRLKIPQLLIHNGPHIWELKYFWQAKFVSTTLVVHEPHSNDKQIHVLEDQEEYDIRHTFKEDPDLWYFFFRCTTF